MQGKWEESSHTSLHAIRDYAFLFCLKCVPSSLISSPQIFWHQGPILWETIFPLMVGGGVEGGGSDDFRMIQAHYMYCAIYFYYYYYYISSTSDQQALDPKAGDPWSLCCCEGVNHQ